LWPETNDKKERARFVEAARLEFLERHSIEKPMTIVEMTALIDEMTNDIVFTEGTNQTMPVSEAIFGIRDEDGDLIEGDEMEDKKEWLWQGVEDRDRFDVIRWYRRDNNIPKGKEIDANQLHNWIFNTVIKTRKIPPEHLISIDAGLGYLGLPPNEVNRQNYYMRWLISVNGS